MDTIPVRTDLRGGLFASRTAAAQLIDGRSATGQPEPPAAAAGSRIACPALLVSAFLVLTGLAACATSPLGRDQLLLFPEDEVARMGAAAFQELKETTPRSENRNVNAYVECVANEITQVLPPSANGDSTPSQDWEVSVFAEDQINAFALPGGKIGVYEGLLGVAENQHQLATVVAHEVAHVLARHSNERISTEYATGTGLELLNVLAGGNTPAKRTIFGLLGLGAQVGVLLPFSRSQETEADLLGLELMAKAGFDPRESITLWHNMNAAGGEGPPEFLSTHPTGETRIRALEGNMSEAARLASEAEASGKRPDCG